ncbi:30S ribosomal protein S20 [candidate division NPL-UPA2 bacterium Unc8]|uniref:Small ribosomal subunit protein bS20 n=1 Tax=candidate division NPL-UPA2 bacterium Unc8 TaxID=1980939 RepID=A0A399G0I2_UNCN2|nr:MAG: 30S ribosomal protein S20 [candidate division NPL-UPA2 bacterium Unc8]
MPVTKSAKKRLRINKKKKAYNIKYKNKARSSLKECEQAVKSGRPGEAKTMLPGLIAILDKMASRGVIHKKRAARKKSRFARKVNQLQSLMTSSSNTNSGENLSDLKSSSA